MCEQDECAAICCLCTCDECCGLLRSTPPEKAQYEKPIETFYAPYASPLLNLKVERH